MLFRKSATHIVFLFYVCLFILPTNLFAATTTQQSTSSSSASSSPLAGVPEGGGSGAHNKAKSGTMIGGILIGVGAITTAIGYAPCPEACNWPWIIGGMVEMVGGAVAMMQNSKAAQDTAPKGINFGGLTTGGSGMGGTPNLPDGLPKLDLEKCKPPVCTCNDAACSQPQISLPPKEDLEKLMRSGTMPDGTSLDDALAKLNENYDKAKSAAAEFNKLSSAGAFDPAGSGLAEGTDSGAGDSSGDSSSNGKDTAGVGLGSASGKRSGGDDTADDFKTEPMIDALAKQRGEQGKVLLMGMNAIDKNGKALTIFERLTRALRGKNDRDLVLAKNEWIRKKALKNKKNSVKLNLNALQKK